MYVWKPDRDRYASDADPVRTDAQPEYRANVDLFDENASDYGSSALPEIVTKPKPRPTNRVFQKRDPFGAKQNSFAQPLPEGQLSDYSPSWEYPAEGLNVYPSPEAASGAYDGNRPVYYDYPQMEYNGSSMPVQASPIPSPDGYAGASPVYDAQDASPYADAQAAPVPFPDGYAGASSVYDVQDASPYADAQAAPIPSPDGYDAGYETYAPMPGSETADLEYSPDVISPLNGEEGGQSYQPALEPNTAQEPAPVAPAQNATAPAKVRAPFFPKKWNASSIAILVGIVLFSAVFIVFAGMLLKELHQNENSGAIIADMREMGAATVAGQQSQQVVAEDTSAYDAKRALYAHLEEEADHQHRFRIDGYEGNPLNIVLPPIATLQAANPDAVGILKIPGLLTENVYQNKENMLYYYDHSGTGASTSYGAVFADSGVDFVRPPENIILYGQSSKADQCFGPLLRFKTEGAAFTAANRTARLMTPYEEETYVLFSVIEMNNTKPVKAFQNIIEPSFSTDADMMHYVVEAKTLSIYPTDLDVGPEDRLLTLSVFSTDGSPLILIYRMVRESET